MSTEMVGLNLVAITRRFPPPQEVAALNDVNLAIYQGEFVGVVGPSGGGKSTLLNVLGLLDTPSSGEYTLNGRATSRASDAELSRHRSDTFAFIFQSFHLLDRRPVVDSVELGLLYRGIPRAERRERAYRALEQLGLMELAARRANTLSGGQRQRIAVARALASGAPVVLADEPTGNLDSASAEQVMVALEQVRAKGATLVLVTHSAELSSRAGRLVQVHDGSIVDDVANPAFTVADPIAGDCIGDDAPPGRLVPHPPGEASRLRFSDLLADALATMRSRVGRTASLAAAVALATGLAVATLGIAESARAQVGGVFDARLNRDVTIVWQAGDTLSAQSDKVRETAPARLAELAGTDAAAIVEGLPPQSVRTSPTRPSFVPALLRITDDFERAARLETRWSAGHAHRLSSDEVMLGSSLAEQLEMGPLDAEPTVLVGGSARRVVALIDEAPRDPTMLGAVVVPSTAFVEVDAIGTVRAMLLTVPGGAPQVARQAPLAIDPYQPELLEVLAPPDPRNLRVEIEAGVQTAMAVVTVIAFVGSIGALANAMLLAVSERRGEIGLRRALGALRRHIWSLIAIESSIIGLLGGVLGLGLGLAAVLTVTMLQGWLPIFDFALAPLAVGLGAAVGVTGGLLPSARAARAVPADALRT